jgi:type III secretion system FlhB-like substrate exporter
MEQLDLWLLRLQNCNRDENIPNQLYHSIKEFIQDAFVYDYNLIIEEFNFSKELPAQL